MSLHNDHRKNKWKRQQVVSMMKLRFGWSAPRIAEALEADPEMINHRTGKPWSLATVKLDLIELAERWRAESLDNTETLMGRHLAQLQEAKHHAWALGDMSNVLKAMKQEADLLGLDAPKKVANTDTKGNDVSRDSQRILVLGGSSEDYIAACVAMAEDKPAPTLEVYDAQ